MTRADLVSQWGSDKIERAERLVAEWESGEHRHMELMKIFGRSAALVEGDLIALDNSQPTQASDMENFVSTVAAEIRADLSALWRRIWRKT